MQKFVLKIAAVSSAMLLSHSVLAIEDVQDKAVIDDAINYVPGEIIVKFNQQPQQASLATVEGILGSNRVQWKTPHHAPYTKGRPNEPHPLSYFRLVVVDSNLDVVSISEQISALAAVEYASVNNRPEPSHLPNDPMFNDQWAHQKISSQGAWDISTGSNEIIVGVIDTGCLINHEDIQANLWVNDDPPNGIDDDGNGFIDDTYGWNFVNNNNDISDVFGHGTQVSGIVAGRIDNGLGIAGIGNLTVMTSKWWHFSGGEFSAAESVYYAIDNGAHVLNLSLGCQCLLPMLEAAVNDAHAAGLVVVASSGNSATNQPAYPAAYPNVMAVAAITINDQLAGFSNWGPHLDVGAPSPNILTASNAGPTQYTPSFGGTSAAAPHVAGLAGLVLSVDPTLTNDEVRALINENADDLGAKGFDDFFGNGRINSQATLEAISLPCPADLDGDASVGTSDLLVLFSLWGTNPHGPPDLDGDGIVGTSDILELFANWGMCK